MILAGAYIEEHSGQSPIHLCCHLVGREVSPMLSRLRVPGISAFSSRMSELKCVKALVYCDGNLCRMDCVNEKGDTALHIAARWGYQGVIEVLLQNGASTSILNRRKETPLQCALNSKILSIMETAHTDNNRRPSHSESPSRSPPQSADTISRDSSESSLSSLSTSAGQEDTKSKYKEVEKLLRAVSDGDLEMVRYLLEWVDDDYEDELEDSLLGKKEFCHPLCQCRTCGPVQKKLSKIPSNGLSVNVTSRDGFTPVHITSLHGHTILLSLLLKHGAQVDAKNANRAIPLHLACHKGHLDVVKILMEYSTGKNKRDVHGNTPLMYACMGNNLEIASLLLEHGASVDLCNVKGNTALHESVRRNHEGLVKLLLFYGAAVDIRNKRQYSPLDYAKENSKIKQLLLSALHSVVADIGSASSLEQSQHIRKKSTNSNLSCSGSPPSPGQSNVAQPNRLEDSQGTSDARSCIEFIEGCKADKPDSALKTNKFMARRHSLNIACTIDNEETTSDISDTVTDISSPLSDTCKLDSDDEVRNQELSNMNSLTGPEAANDPPKIDDLECSGGPECCCVACVLALQSSWSVVDSGSSYTCDGPNQEDCSGLNT
ncbi:hypothetical protein AB205_0103760 [Aquarana catesbeiana]|uniref:Uncharacterized protein n=1 Tax=Aquarana catesbeiana TaxID=8400 RepID=A0A2G9RLC7_AQUCT|nr:hypothetical protein AB205_0103760 [Aquarana catesbeiana]